MAAKGTKIRITKTNTEKDFHDTCENSNLVYEVIRVNKSSYTLKCIDGYMKNTICMISKSSVGTTTKNIYGTTIKIETI